MNNNWRQELLGDYAEDGYTVEQDADITVELFYKDQCIAVFSQFGVTKEIIQAACERHKQRLYSAAGAAP